MLDFCLTQSVRRPQSPDKGSSGRAAPFGSYIVPRLAVISWESRPTLIRREESRRMLVAPA